MTSALARHDGLLRAAIEAHGGYVFSTAGDAFAAAFSTAGSAMAAAVVAQQALAEEPWPQGVNLRVRMGLHVGVAEERDGDYFGPAVNRAARLMGVGHGGQMLVSLPVEELVRDDLPDGVSLRPLGEHPLRGLSRPERIFQIMAADLPADFPALLTSSALPGNLPLPVSSFVGRVEEVKRLGAALGEHRLVTLVGPGGVGKTRLGIEAAALVAENFPDGVWFVELAALSEPGAVVHAVATSLAIRPVEGANLLESVAETMAQSRALVLLDNCEHVVDRDGAVTYALQRLGRVTDQRAWSLWSIRTCTESLVPAAEGDERPRRRTARQRPLARCDRTGLGVHPRTSDPPTMAQ